MSINYKLSIGGLKKKFSVQNFNDVVVEISFSVNASSDPVTKITGSDEEGNDIVEIEIPSFSYSCGSTVSLDASELDEESFIDFNSVTKDTVVEWLLASEGVDTLDNYSYVKSSVNNIQKRIDDLAEEINIPTDWTVSNY